MQETLIVQIFAGLAVVLLSGAIVGLFSMNRSLTQVRTWQVEHEKRDDDRKNDIKDILRRLDSKLDHAAALAAALNNLADALRCLQKK